MHKIKLIPPASLEMTDVVHCMSAEVLRPGFNHSSDKILTKLSFILYMSVLGILKI